MHIWVLSAVTAGEATEQTPGRRLWQRSIYAKFRCRSGVLVPLAVFDAPVCSAFRVWRGVFSLSGKTHAMTACCSWKIILRRLQARLARPILIFVGFSTTTVRIPRDSPRLFELKISTDSEAKLLLCTVTLSGGYVPMEPVVRFAWNTQKTSSRSPVGKLEICD